MKFDLSKQQDWERAQDYLVKLTEQGSKAEIKRCKESKTLNQNNYFHVACQCLASETGYTTQEIKDIIKESLDWMQYKKGDRIFVRSTADLSKEEYSNLIDGLLTFATNHGFAIPSPDDYLQNSFEIEKQYENER